MKQILLINNYDSFVYNVKQLLDESGLASTTMVFNDQLSEVNIEDFDKIVISPGPGLPSEAGALKSFIEDHKSKPMLGICLGFQAIGEVFGAKLYRLPTIFHGHESEVFIKSEKGVIFNGIETSFKAGRYHSWALDLNSFPEVLEITSQTQEGIIMSFAHKDLPITAVLFHPESIMTPQGKKMIENWLLE